ncbi:hypothetical protein PsAD46_01472 [Pseudovibrio sp. Ad46]|uniref:GlcG/HbpS family heme-binding protein n=1 Tax=unclassified Pseudovibrio TaxID=2627060 RepID=UPI00070FAF9E|nr:MULTISPECIES: heme-binding protein [unclassified Pseudovibrio]KZK91249.1 hypothetical protein PsAD46_01472 [Pseudovibrio sp. Ad46]
MKSFITGAALLAMSAGFSIAQAEDESAFVSFKSLKPEIAMKLAVATMEACREGGYQISAVVVDRFGQTQAAIRDRYAGVHTVDTARGKAWTAVSFRGSTLEIQQEIKAGNLSAGLRDIPGAVALGGGLPVESAGAIVGGIGVSGAPSPKVDEECAQSGLEEISDLLDF